MGPADAQTLTIDDLAVASGTTTRRIRSLQTLGLLPHPTLHGRIGLYDAGHRDRLEAVLHLQRQGFSLESLVLLFDALRAGRSLDDVLGVAESGGTDGDVDSDLYGFAELQPTRSTPRRERPFLSVIPTTVWDESQAS